MDGREEGGRAAFDAEQARAHADEVQAAASAEEPRPLEKSERVALVIEAQGQFRVINLGHFSHATKAGSVHVDWDDQSHGVLSAKVAAECLRRAEGEDALPRHRWCFDPPASLEQPACSACTVQQTDENEFGPCRGGAA